MEPPPDLESFFVYCDTLAGPQTEPEWEEHLQRIEDSRKDSAHMEPGDGGPTLIMLPTRTAGEYHVNQEEVKSWRERKRR